jgi:hypothetical protein
LAIFYNNYPIFCKNSVKSEPTHTHLGFFHRKDAKNAKILSVLSVLGVFAVRFFEPRHRLSGFMKGEVLKMMRSGWNNGVE